MPDEIDIVIDTRELDVALRNLPRRLARAAAGEALQAAGEVLLAAVVAHTPERTEEETPEQTSLGPGILKADMHTEINFSAKYGSARVKVGPSREIGGLVAYRQNNGWTLTAHGKKGHKIRAIPGKHFLEAAFDESAEEAVDVFIDRLANNLGFGENAIPEGDSHDVDFG